MSAISSSTCTSAQYSMNTAGTSFSGTSASSGAVAIEGSNQAAVNVVSQQVNSLMGQTEGGMQLDDMFKLAMALVVLDILTKGQDEEGDSDPMKNLLALALAGGIGGGSQSTSMMSTSYQSTVYGGEALTPSSDIVTSAYSPAVTGTQTAQGSQINTTA